MNETNMQHFLTIILVATLVRGRQIRDENGSCPIRKSNEVCFGNCITSAKCDVFVKISMNRSVEEETRLLHFDMKSVYSGEDKVWMGVAFSEDNLMGDEVVTECVVTPTFRGVTESFNYFDQYHIRSNKRINDQFTKFIEKIETINNELHCKWSMSVTNNVISRFKINQSFILVAVGRMRPFNKVFVKMKHSWSGASPFHFYINDNKIMSAPVSLYPKVRMSLKESRETITRKRFRETTKGSKRTTKVFTLEDYDDDDSEYDDTPKKKATVPVYTPPSAKKSTKKANKPQGDKPRSNIAIIVVAAVVLTFFICAMIFIYWTLRNRDSDKSADQSFSRTTGKTQTDAEFLRSLQADYKKK